VQHRIKPKIGTNLQQNAALDDKRAALLFGIHFGPTWPDVAGFVEGTTQ